MNEEALKVFNMYLENENLNGVLNCLPNIFIDLTPENIKTKNLFLYLLGTIFKLPEEYLDYVKTLFIYDLYVPVEGISPKDAINFLRSITFNDFIKARNIFYEYMNDGCSKELRKAILNLLALAKFRKNSNNSIIFSYLKDNDYKGLYIFINNIVNNSPAFNNMYTLYLLLKDLINEDYEEIDILEDDLTIYELVKYKKYFKVWEYYNRLLKQDENNIEIQAIVRVVSKILKERYKGNLKVGEHEEKVSKPLDKDMYLDFLDSVSDYIDKEGFVILNPESEEVNNQMKSLAYYIPYLSAYEIGRCPKQIVINQRRYKKFTPSKESYICYNKGNWENYIKLILEKFKYILPDEGSCIRLAQAYFREGLLNEGINALKLAIGLREYDSNPKYHHNLFQYYMMLDYFNKRIEKEQNLEKFKRK